MPREPSPPSGPPSASGAARLDAAEVERFFAALALANPAPATELLYTNPFTLLVAVVLSAQATDVGVNKATRRLFAVADTPASMLALGEDGIKEHVRSLGFFNQKAKNVLALSQAIVERHGGSVPRERDALQALPGVGRKTANVVLNEAFGEPTIAVDTHVFRVANRTGLAPAKTVELVEAALEAIVPPAFRHGAHHWLILHGRYTCLAKKPLCPRCVVRDLCRFEPKTAETPPAPSRRKRPRGDAGIPS